MPNNEAERLFGRTQLNAKEESCTTVVNGGSAPRFVIELGESSSIIHRFKEGPAK
jgi:hypothetical protein